MSAVEDVIVILKDVSTEGESTPTEITTSSGSQRERDTARNGG
jgi:hypothetical protein